MKYFYEKFSHNEIISQAAEKYTLGDIETLLILAVKELIDKKSNNEKNPVL